MHSLGADEDQENGCKCHVTRSPRSECLLHKEFFSGRDSNWLPAWPRFYKRSELQVIDGVISREHPWYHWYVKLRVPAGGIHHTPPFPGSEPAHQLSNRTTSFSKPSCYIRLHHPYSPSSFLFSPLVTYQLNIQVPQPSIAQIQYNGVMEPPQKKSSSLSS